MIKKLFTALFLVVFTLESFASNLSNLDEMEVKFFNVGQGNCTLIKLPEGPPLLIDGGSTESPGGTEKRVTRRRNTKANNIAGEIARDINLYLSSTNRSEIEVIISHADKDHFNLTPDIFQGSLEGKSMKFLLGGKMEDYQPPKPEGNTYKHKFKRLLGLPTSEVKYAYKGAEPSCSLIELTNHLNYGRARGEILSAAGKNTNDASIVLKIEHGNHSVMLTGDIEGHGLDNLINGEKDIKSTILQMCHHGAKTERTNNLNFLKAVHPTYAVFSAALSVSFGHPSSKVLGRLIDTTRDNTVSVSKHEITVAGELKKNLLKLEELEFKTRFTKETETKKRQFYTYLTTYGFYGTHDSGNIIFKWDSKSEAVPEPTCSIKIKEENLVKEEEGSRKGKEKTDEPSIHKGEKGEQASLKRSLDSGAETNEEKSTIIIEEKEGATSTEVSCGNPENCG